MLAFLLATTLFSPTPTQAEGTILRFNGRGFSFSLLQPEGWVIDTRSAPQISSFVIHPQDSDWRRADAVIYSRLVQREGEQEVGEFLEEDWERFLEACPFADDLEEDAVRKLGGFYLQQRYRCPGVREEVVAVMPVSRFFFVMLLASQQDGALEEAIPVFEKVLKSLNWTDLQQP